MDNEAVKIKISEWLPDVQFDESGEWLNIEVDAAKWHPLAVALRDDELLQYDFLFCLTCVDWKTHQTMVYHLTSTSHRWPIVVKCKLEAGSPSISSVADVWKTAEFHEREVYEMFGVNFEGHPDLRLLILPDGWEGKNPLRKDFEDPINMIKL